MLYLGGHVLLLTQRSLISNNKRKILLWGQQPVSKSKRKHHTLEPVRAKFKLTLFMSKSMRDPALLSPPL